MPKAGPGLLLLLLSSCYAHLHTTSAVPFARHGWRRPFDARKVPSFEHLHTRVNLLSKSRQDYSWTVVWQDLMDADTANASVPSQNGPAELQQLVRCLNKPPNANADHTAATTTWSSITSGQLGRLNVVAAASHQHSGSATACPVSAVTFGTLDRLSQLHAQCRKWAGPLSAALYEPLLQQDGSTQLNQECRVKLRFAVEQVMHMLAELSRLPDACQLDVLLVYEIVSDPAALPLVPLNQLRNLARIPVRTPLVALLDVDLLPSRSLYTRVMRTGDYLIQQTQNKSVFIMPAFDLSDTYQTLDWAQALASLNNKRILLTCLEEDLAVPFNNKWPRHHRMTKFKKWTHAGADYDTEYEAWAEPWLLCSRTGIPWHDERYRGYGGDKLQHTLALNQTGHKFKVLHDAFIIHRPHKPADAKALYKSKSTTQQGGAGLSQFVDGLFHAQMSQPAGTPYQPVVTQRVVACLAALPWWQTSGQ